MEVQLERVRRDLLDAATTARTAEEARVEAEGREAQIRSGLETALIQMEEANSKVNILVGQESELKKELESAKVSKDALAEIEVQRAQVTEVQKEVKVLREEKEAALVALAEARATYDGKVTILEAEIDSLNKDVDVHREQMELAQIMLDEKESLALELRRQLDDVLREEAMQALARNRDLNKKVTTDLQKRNGFVEIPENKSETANEECIVDDGTVKSISTVPLTSVKSKDVRDQAMLAEKEFELDCLERELRTSKLQVEQLLKELDVKKKHADHLSKELERCKATVDELETQLDEKNKCLESLQNQLKNEKSDYTALCEKLTKLQIDLSIAVESAEAAEDAHQHATCEMHAAKTARQEAVFELEKLKSLVNELEIRSASAITEAEIIKSDADKERKSSMQAAAALAATNAARQVEMEMTIEKMQKEVRSCFHRLHFGCWDPD